jgi:hypothetical protein
MYASDEVHRGFTFESSTQAIRVADGGLICLARL